MSKNRLILKRFLILGIIGIGKIKHLLLLGRVTSGIGGQIIVENAKKVLDEEFPNLKVNIEMPDESNRRVGQSIAAASLTEVK